MNAKRLWNDGVTSEIDFWHMMIETRGGKWPEEFAARLEPESDFDPQLGLLLPTDPSPRILDVGAGPLTTLGKRWRGVPLNITPVDPLAHVYNELLRKYGLSAPIPTELSYAETLSQHFPHNHFDLVTCINALDHSISPLLGIAEMVKVVKENGAVVLQHNLNEGVNEQYFGLHQWNLDIQEDRFIIWNRGNRIDVEENLFGISLHWHIAEQSITQKIESETIPRHLWVTLIKTGEQL